MHYRSLLGTLALALLVTAGCSGSPQNPAAPSTAPTGTGDAAADGSTLKAGAPTPLSPVNDLRLNNRQPTLQIRNAEGRYAGAAFAYEFAVLDMAGRVIRSATVSGGNGSTTWVYPAADELAGSTRYQWRARAVLEGAHGPWSSLSTFLTVAALPGCEARPLEADRTQCLASVAAISENWPRCANGGHVGCHKFAREVASALATSDPNWGILGKPPGVQQCNLDRCSSTVVNGFGEDVVAYCRNASTCQNRGGPNGRRDWQGFDIVLGAGAPGARFAWNALDGNFNRGNNYWAPVP